MLKVIEFMTICFSMIENETTSWRTKNQTDISNHKKNANKCYSRRAAGHGSTSLGVYSVLYIVASSNGAVDLYATPSGLKDR